MDRLLAILRAASCRSTHHYFALDGLRYLRTEEGEALKGILLKYHADYLQGAKDPDDRFRDFQNHVLHVQDRYWGGATAAADQWYGSALAFLKKESWKEAAHALGVLSHYFTDPMMPLHTAQSDRETVLHRPLEWSICCSYQQIDELSRSGDLLVKFQLGVEPNWLTLAIRRGAEIANRYYQPLLDGYNLQKGTIRPAEGLTDDQRWMLAELFGIVHYGWSQVIDRIAIEADVKFPAPSLTIPTLIAGLRMPISWILGRIADKAESRNVAAIWEEFTAHGALYKHLPDECRQVRATHHAERLNELPKSNPTITVANSTGPQTVSDTVVSDAEVTGMVEPTHPVQPQKEQRTESNDSAVIHRLPTPRLTLNSPLADAPSIGPKTAERFSRIGIETVGAFLDVLPRDLCMRLRTKWITEFLLDEWQHQCRLVCAIPKLNSVSAQLLVGAGVRSHADLARQLPERLLERVREYADTSAGKRILRGGNVPGAADISKWIGWAIESSIQKRIG